MEATSRPPEGRSAKEAMVLVMADQARWDELHELWLQLLPHEQEELIDTTQEMVKNGSA